MALVDTTPHIARDDPEVLFIDLKSTSAFFLICILMQRAVMFCDESKYFEDKFALNENFFPTKTGCFTLPFHVLLQCTLKWVRCFPRRFLLQLGALSKHNPSSEVTTILSSTMPSMLKKPEHSIPKDTHIWCGRCHNGLAVSSLYFSCWTTYTIIKGIPLVS